jgi:hypothetical protein
VSLPLLLLPRLLLTVAPRTAASLTTRDAGASAAIGCIWLAAPGLQPLLLTPGAATPLDGSRRPPMPAAAATLRLPGAF